MFDRFAHPWLLGLLTLVPVLFVVSWLRSRRSRLLYPGAGAAGLAGATLRTRLVHLPRLLRAGALGLLIVALARPQDILGLVRTSTEGVAIQLVIDRSSSMTEGISMEGRPTTRLEAVKKVASEFIAGNGDDLKGRTGDMIGVIGFGSYADTICPLVREHEALLEMVARIEVSPLRSDQGTAIGDAVALAAARLREAEKEVVRGLGNEATPDFSIKSKAVILLTDGRNNRGEIDPLQAAELCQQWGIKLYTIGIGGGEAIEIGGLRIPRGASVDATTMQAMANRTGGRFFLADSAESLREIYAEIDSLEKTQIETSESVDYTERYTPFAAAGLALLAIESLLVATLLRRTP
jgi:Ca-activated chloride channel family protein